MVFPIVMYGCESWTIKKAECQRIDAFELWCWRRLLRVPWTARRCKQSILKETVLNIHWKDWCWSWNSNTLATLCKELTHWKRPWCWERLKAGGEVDDRGQNDWIASPTQWTWAWVNSGRWWWTGRPGVLQSMGSKLDTTDRMNWTERSIGYLYHIFFYPLIHQWTFRLLPCLGYCKQGCNEHRAAWIFGLWFSPDICPGVGLPFLECCLWAVVTSLSNGLGLFLKVSAKFHFFFWSQPGRRWLTPPNLSGKNLGSREGIFTHAGASFQWSWSKRKDLSSP